MVRMTVTVDERLLQEAQKLAQAKTKREVIEIALREFVRRERRRALAARAGSLELSLSQEELQRLREER